MKKILTIILLLIILLNIISLVSAHGEETFAQAEEIIQQKISCEELSEGQLEILGDYFMEQMHPGELHEIMDERMGGEGSESLRLVHINIGRSFYCGEHTALSSGIMSTMMGRTYGMGGMMGINNNYGINTLCSSVGGIWCYWPSLGGIINLILSLTIIILLIFFIIRLVKKLQEKSKSKTKIKGHKK